MKTIVIAITILTLALHLSATESTDNALFKGTQPLSEAMGKPIYSNRVFQHGYHCWDPALIKAGDTYHLFYSRWKMVPGKVNNLAHWMDTSEIVHATSKNLLGPYTNIENPALSARDNHGWWLHNCKVTPQYKSDGAIERYVLYFINVKRGAIAGTSWLYSDDLSSGSWYGQHAEFTKEAKFNNPAILFYPDGSAYGLSKNNDPAYPDTGRHLFAYYTKDFKAHPGKPDERWGKPLPNNRGSLNQLPGDVDHEDACIWEVNNQYHAIMTDMSGRATGGKKKAVMHWFTSSKTGTDYRLYSDTPIVYRDTPIQFAEGNLGRYYRLERPNVYIDPVTGAVQAFMLSCVPTEETQSNPEEGASIIIWPVNNWKPQDNVSSATKVVRYGKLGELPLAAVAPNGWTREFLERQRAGLTGHPHVSGYPFNTPMWNGTVYRPVGHWGSSWWPYEQTGYYIDGAIRYAHLLKDQTLLKKIRANFQYTFEHVKGDGKLGGDNPVNDWSRAVFARAMIADYGVTKNPAILKSLTRNYLTTPHLYSETLACSNIEVLCWLYAQTGNRALLEMAEESYRAGNQQQQILNPAGHAVCYCEKPMLPAILYDYTGKQEYLDTTVNGLAALQDKHVLVDGVPSGVENLYGKAPDCAHEMCIAVALSWSYGYVLMATKDPVWADKIERIVFNAGLGGLTKDFRAHQYYSAPN